MHRYRAYGLAVTSEIELPELVPEVGGGAPDLHVRLGGVPETLADPVEQRVTWAARPGAWLHEIEGVARYYVHDDGREVRIEPTGGSPADIRAFLFASTLGAVLHQRGQFVLHASAVVGPGGTAVAVAGPSGTGKSTSLAALTRRGYRLLTDDKLVVRFGPDGPEGLPGSPTVRLWPDAVRRLGVATDGLPTVREGIDKVLYRPGAFHSDPAPLRALVVLGRQRDSPPEGTPATLAAERLAPHVAIRALLRQTYRRRIVDGSGMRTEHFAWAARLADSVAVFRLLRPRHGESVEAVADAVERALADAAAEG